MKWKTDAEGFAAELALDKLGALFIFLREQTWNKAKKKTWNKADLLKGTFFSCRLFLLYKLPHSSLQKHTAKFQLYCSSQIRNAALKISLKIIVILWCKYMFILHLVAFL